MPDSKKSPERIGVFSTYRFSNSKTLFGLCLGGRFLLRYRSAFFCEERFWATCFFEEGFLLLATEVLLVAFFELPRPLFAGNSLVFRAGPAGRKRLLALFLRLETTCLALLCESATSEAVR